MEIGVKSENIKLNPAIPPYIIYNKEDDWLSLMPRRVQKLSDKDRMKQIENYVNWCNKVQQPVSGKILREYTTLKNSG